MMNYFRASIQEIEIQVVRNELYLEILDIERTALKRIRGKCVPRDTIIDRLYRQIWREEASTGGESWMETRFNPRISGRFKFQL